MSGVYATGKKKGLPKCNTAKPYLCTRCDKRTKLLPHCRPCAAQVKRSGVCVGCGLAFTRTVTRISNDAKKYCSRECAYKSQVKVFPLSPVHFNTCKQCGKRWVTKSPKSLCSTDCRLLHARTNGLNYWYEKRAVELESRPLKSCGECLVEFKPNYSDATYCSNVCGKRAGNRINRKKRKAKLRAITTESVNPTLVFIRDNWTCQACGKPTPKELRGLFHDDAPQLDHIVPLAKGGAHSYANTQCLCKRCNAEKSDRLDWEYKPIESIGYGGTEEVLYSVD